jgi:LEA14-like dessication related protein
VGETVGVRGRQRRTATVLLLAGLAVLHGCAQVVEVVKAAPKPSARVTGARFQGLSLEQVGLVFDVEITNPYSVALPLLDTGYAIDSGGQQIVAGRVKPSGSIPAQAATSVKVPATIKFSSLLAALKGVRPGAVVPYTARIDLAVDAPVIGLTSLPVTGSGELPIPAAPDVRMTSFNIGSLTVDKVSAMAKLDLRNNNQFEIDLAKLGLDLALGGKAVGQTKLASPAKLAPGQSATVLVPVSFSPKALGTGFFSLLSGREAGYAISGSLDAGTPFGPMALPFSHSGNTKLAR